MAEERSEQELVRIAKLQELRANGFAFPNDMQITSNTADVLNSTIVEDVEKAPRLTVAGRLVQMRVMGKAIFAHILDRKGKLQLYIKKDIVGEESFAEVKKFDIGDIIGVSGYVFLTKTGEKTLVVEQVRLLTKSMIPLPEKFHGLTDVEARYRYRYVDLISNTEVREIFIKRAKIINELRAFLNEHDFVEVETPVLNNIAGGADARPFSTHYNALHADMNLRISLELPLKKLVVGGIERVYEIGRVFRNEGLSKKHNPEFTMVEFYHAYATYEDLMKLTEEMLSRICQKVNGTLKVKFGDKEIDFTPPWQVVSMVDSIYEIGGVERTFDLNTLEGVHAAAEKYKVELPEPQDWGRCVDALWGELVEHKIVNPVFITHHPFSISPLARKNQQNPDVTDRFEVIVAGMELVNAFSELNDAEDQRARFEAQAERKRKGDEEAQEIEEDFLRALEYGMPPTAGEGIGIDRLVMLLTDSPTIRDVLLFPQLKPLTDTTQVSDEKVEG